MMCDECGKEINERSSMKTIREKIERKAYGVEDSENPDTKRPKDSSAKPTAKFDSEISDEMMSKLKGMTLNTPQDIEVAHKIMMEYMG
jgi:hypothetical protein